MVLDDINPEEVGKEDGIEVYNKVWGALESHLYIATPQTFKLESFLESLILRQDRAVELLQKICNYVAADRNWADKGLCTMNLRVVDLKMQGL